MKKFFKNYGYALGIYLYFATLLIVAGCSDGEKVKYDDLNTYRNSQILRIDVDSTTTPYTYMYYIKDSHGRYRDIVVDPEWAVIFEEGDIL